MQTSEHSRATSGSEAGSAPRMRAIQIAEFGGPEVLRVAEVPAPSTGTGEVAIDVSSAGVNFADTHKTEESYVTTARLPFVPGTEVVGTTDDGRRVVALLATGGYAERATAHSQLCWDVPDGVPDGAALALVLQGTTAWHLLKTSARLAEGESVVVHAAAGGVGTLAIQLAKRFGASRVIGIASTDEKRALAERIGADATVDGTRSDLADAIRDANGGADVDVILEMTGGSTFAQSLDAVAPFGRLVHFGQAGRQAPAPIDPTALLATSRGVLGFWFGHMRQRPQLIDQAMQKLLAMVEDGRLVPVVGPTYELADAARAHTDLRNRTTTGKVVLTCS
jgi:NADPH2:quinone reductase